MKSTSFESGVGVLEASDWNDFLTFVTSQLEYNHFVWRGQREGSWLLESTLDRILRKAEFPQKEKAVDAHLNRFMYATRGRRGINPPAIPSENDWWALGQHHGLATPLLDWSTSPFVAAFFAYESTEPSSTGFRMVFAISKLAVDRKCAEISEKHERGDRPPIIEFINPLSDENSRLVNQGGLFTRAPLGVDIEQWFKGNFSTEKKRVFMWKICLPDNDREIALKSLNRMNINHLSLFPDLHGASMYTNLDLEIKHY